MSEKISRVEYALTMSLKDIEAEIEKILNEYKSWRHRLDELEAAAKIVRAAGIPNDRTLLSFREEIDEKRKTIKTTTHYANRRMWGTSDEASAAGLEWLDQQAAEDDNHHFAITYDSVDDGWYVKLYTVKPEKLEYLA